MTDQSRTDLVNLLGEMALKQSPYSEGVVKAAIIKTYLEGGINATDMKFISHVLNMPTPS